MDREMHLWRGRGGPMTERRVPDVRAGQSPHTYQRQRSDEASLLVSAVTVQRDYLLSLHTVMRDTSSNTFSCVV